jgi:TrmH family RNA methyltransferase
MISKAKIKYIKSLQHKKIRNSEGVFVAEGHKVVGDLLASYHANIIIATNEWITTNKEAKADEIIEVTEEELARVSFLQHPQMVLAVFSFFEQNTPNINISDDTLYLALDGVQDPGNLGTIIRIADWFGITDIFCSNETADIYNPKVVQATMGSIARVKLHYTDLKKLIGSLPPDYPIYGTLLDGTDIYKENLSAKGIIVMGNEGNGISPEIRKVINRKLLIPNYPIGRETAESLNVAIATAVTCAEFRRRMI